MPERITDLIQARGPERFDLHERHLNTQLVRVLKTIGFDRQGCVVAGLEPGTDDFLGLEPHHVEFSLEGTSIATEQLGLMAETDHGLPRGLVRRQRLATFGVERPVDHGANAGGRRQCEVVMLSYDLDQAEVALAHAGRRGTLKVLIDVLPP